MLVLLFIYFLFSANLAILYGKGNVGKWDGYGKCLSSANT